MTEVAGRTAFITGGANGIGLGIARAFARAGARVALADLDAEALDKARIELSELTDVETVVFDVRDRDASRELPTKSRPSLGRCPYFSTTPALPVALLRPSSLTNCGIGEWESTSVA